MVSNVTKLVQRLPLQYNKAWLLRKLNMADELCLFRFVTIFILSWPHSFALTFVAGKNWQHYCVSLQDNSVCTIESFLELAQRVCRSTDLLEFNDWSFTDKSLLLQVFPVDKETRNYVRQVPGVVFSSVRPVPLKHKPHLVAMSSEVITDILDLKAASVLESLTFVEFVAGNKILPNAILLSHRYGGHQVRFKQSSAIADITVESALKYSVVENSYKRGEQVNTKLICMSNR